MSSQFQLLKEQRFRPLFMTQFLGAFNDNVFKTALITLVAFSSTQLSSIDSATLATILPGMFILPFFLFSATAGQLADKFEKSQMIRFVKLLEIGIMLFASIGFFLHNLVVLAIALLLMGLHSTLFGPVKYSYLPQQLSEGELTGGNGMLEMGSFVAILLGQIFGAWLATQPNSETLTSLCVVLLALIGYWTSRGVLITKAGAPELRINWNPITETINNLSFIWQRQSLWLAIIGISWFWFIGATLLAQFPHFAKTTLHGDESVFILILSVFSFGIGIGSLLCEKLSNHQVELGLVLFGGIGLSVFGFDLSVTSASIDAALSESLITRTYIECLQDLRLLHLLTDLLGIGVFGGIYIVPLYAFIQSQGETSHQSRIIAANNIMNALFMVISAVFSLWLLALGFNISQLFLTTAFMTGLLMVCLCLKQPAYLKRFYVWASSPLSK